MENRCRHGEMLGKYGFGTGREGVPLPEPNIPVIKCNNNRYNEILPQMEKNG